MPFIVRMSDDARSDLIGIGDYIVQSESRSRARYVIGEIEQRVEGLAEFPARGRYVREMLSMGITDFREIYFRPFRIVYEVTDDAVDIHLIADGRRDMQTLLMQRLLRD